MTHRRQSMRRTVTACVVHRVDGGGLRRGLAVRSGERTADHACASTGEIDCAGTADSRARARLEVLRHVSQRAAEDRGPARSTRLTPIRSSNSAETWEKVVVQLRSRAMPPPSMPRPDNATYDAVAAWLETELDRAAARASESWPAGGSPSAQSHGIRQRRSRSAGRRDRRRARCCRPTRRPTASTPTPTRSAIEPALLDRYLTAAAKIARVAVGDPTLRPAVERYTAVKGNSNEQTWLWQTERLGEDVLAGLARRDRGAPLLPGRWRIRLQAPAAAGRTPA